MTTDFKLLLFGALIFIAVSCDQSTKEETKETVFQGIETVTPETVGFSLDSLIRIDSMIAKYVQKGFIPGASVLVARHGKIAYETVGGWRDRENKIAMKKDDIFRLASMTKPITSLAIMQLYESGKLDVNDPVSKYIPEFANQSVLESYEPADSSWTARPAIGEVTIAHLLTHTSGLNYGFIDTRYGGIYAKNNIAEGFNPFELKLEAIMAALGKLPLAFDPGTKFSYGVSTDVLGRVVEVASGSDLNTYTKNNILDPLGMKDTWYYSKDTLEPRLVICYMPLGDTAITRVNMENDPIGLINYPTTGAKSYYSGGSGLSGTARDYFVFCQSLLNGGTWGDVRVLQDSTLNLMRTNQMDTVSYPWGPGKFGFGFHVFTEDNPNVPFQKAGRFSWGGIFHTVFWIDPARDIVAVMMSQVLQNPNGDGINAEFETLVNAALVDDSK